MHVLQRVEIHGQCGSAGTARVRPEDDIFLKRFSFDRLIFIVLHWRIRIHSRHHLGSIPLLAELFDSMEGHLSLSWLLADEAATSFFLD